MKWTAALMPLIAFLSSMKRVASFCEFPTFSSPIASYILLYPDLSNETNPINFYTVMAQRCQYLGPGWDVGTIDDNKEFQFFSHVHRFSLDQSSYFIGGTTDTTPGQMELRQFGWPDNGEYRVMATYRFQFRTHFFFSAQSFKPVDGILCEKGTNQNTGHAFESRYSLYQKMANDKARTYNSWRKMCAGLGEGWAVAFIESEWELEFLRLAQQYFTDIRNYWIDGFTNFDNSEYFEPCNWGNRRGPGTNRVVVSTRYQGVHNRTMARFRAVRGDRRIRGVMCEKEKGKGLFTSSDSAMLASMLS